MIDIFYFSLILLLSLSLRRISYNLYMIFLLPGTIAHELSHFIIGLITLASPTKFSLIPYKNKDSNYWVLGSVEFNNLNMFNAIFTGFAPLSLIYVAYRIYMNINLNQFLMIFIIFQLIISSIPSRQDLKIVLSYKLGIIFYIILIIGGIYLNENYDINYLLNNIKFIGNRFFQV